ncbi:anti-virulence regulator CigR family protein [Paracandidimonas soli]|nr:anti-virulence regulator CigR family protein [Paracandidimonas soli]
MMKRRAILIASMLAGSAWAFGSLAAPPEGRGNGNGSKGNSGKGNAGGNNKSERGRRRDGDVHADLLYAGITAVLARRYAIDLGLGGYSALPPGIRRNLARGKPLPPGIAKKMAPASLLGRLPRYPGYEWRIAGSDLILISLATALVADILYDVFD